MMCIKWLYLSATIICSVASFGQVPKTDAQPKVLYIPALVENRAGKVIYDIPFQDFLVVDNGTPRSIVLASDFSLKPIALILVIRTGHNAQDELRTIGGLSGLLNAVVSQPLDRTAIITYDQEPRLIQEFTSDSSDSSLSELQSGNAGASLYDALHLAVTVMDREPDNEQKVIIMIGGARDHGSNLSDPEPLIEEIASRNVAVYGLAFLPPRRGFTAELHVLNPFSVLAMRQNAAQSLAELTGGDFYEFKNAKSFEERMLAIASHVHGRYMLRMDIDGAEPGLHSLRVQAQISGDHRVSAKTAYFVPSSKPKDSGP
jgi:VWFA-related protein